MITLNQQKIVALKQVLGEPTITVSGDSSKGERKMSIAFPVVNEKGERLNPIVKTYTGVDFNNIDGQWTSDKELVGLVFASLDIDPTLADTMPDDLHNPEE